MVPRGLSKPVVAMGGLQCYRWRFSGLPACLSYFCPNESVVSVLARGLSFGGAGRTGLWCALFALTDEAVTEWSSGCHAD